MNKCSVVEHVKQMKGMAELLAKKSFPTVSPMDEEEISVLKQRIITLDGYEVTIYCSKSSHNGITLDTVQIYSRNMSYLPFRIVCKVAKMFFSIEPGFMDISDSRLLGTPEYRQIYIWTTYSNQDGIIPFEKNPLF